MTKKLIKKQKAHAFRKDVYLLAKDQSGIKYWLEAPSWDCGWYWGFGYVETYTNNQNPAKSKDISSHQHFSGFVGSQEYYDSEKKCFIRGDYIHNVFNNPLFTSTVFTEAEGWILSELFKCFYHLQGSAEIFGRGNSNICDNPLKDILKNEEWTTHINTVLIPAITKEILNILTP